jgi:hypothetical protein
MCLRGQCFQPNQKERPTYQESSAVPGQRAVREVDLYNCGDEKSHGSVNSCELYIHSAIHDRSLESRTDKEDTRKVSITLRMQL